MISQLIPKIKLIENEKSCWLQPYKTIHPFTSPQGTSFFF